MKETKRYNKLLKKMFIIESIGEIMYVALYSKTPHEAYKPIYKKLSNNERKTGQLIEKELNRLSCPAPLARKKVIVSVAVILFYTLPSSLLEKLLRKTLERRMFSMWFHLYHEYNENFWRALVFHERLQHELLNINSA